VINRKHLAKSLEEIMNRTPPTRVPLTLAVVTAALISLAAFVASPPGFAQPAARSLPIDLFVTTFLGVQTADECMTRVQTGFSKAGYTNITLVPNTGVRGVILSGDNAGVTSMATCFPASAVILALTSAGTSSLGEAAPNAQNSRLLAAITK
jgi:hypothetical protein